MVVYTLRKKKKKEACSETKHIKYRKRKVSRVFESTPQNTNVFIIIIII